MLPSDRTERLVLFILISMFLLGLWMLYQEIDKWRKKRQKVYGKLRFPLSERRASRHEHSQPPLKTAAEDRTNKAA
jgi:hypothetical protein